MGSNLAQTDTVYDPYKMLYNGKKNETLTGKSLDSLERESGGWILNWKG